MCSSRDDFLAFSFFLYFFISFYVHPADGQGERPCFFHELMMKPITIGEGGN
jgi:hypothetical protein